MSEGWREFAPYLKAQARGPSNLGELKPGFSEEAMDLMLRGIASPTQVAGFLLVGRARTESFREIAAYVRASRQFVREIHPSTSGTPVVTVAGGFDGKVRTINVGAAASLVAAAAGGRVLMVGAERVPPKCGRTVFDTLRALGVPAPQPPEMAEKFLVERGLAAMSTEHYLPELHDMLQLRREMVRRTALNVVEKLVSPIPDSSLMVGITHRPFLETLSKALIELDVERALVYQAIEGSDEAPLDGNSSLVLVNNGQMEELRCPPETLALSRATKAHLAWRGAEDESRRLRAALDGSDGPVRDLILYNAALRLWVAGDGASLEECLESARRTLESGAVPHLTEEIGPMPVAGR